MQSAPTDTIPTKVDDLEVGMVVRWANGTTRTICDLRSDTKRVRIWFKDVGTPSALTRGSTLQVIPADG